MTSSKTVLQMRNIKKAFGATQALKGIDLDIYAKEIHAVVGANGAGKSTLMKIIAGIYKPDSGIITYKGDDITGHAPVDIQKHGIQTVHQVLNVVPSMSVLENILIAKPPVKSGFLSWKSAEQKVKDVLEKINLPIDLKMIAGSLTVSEQQFIILARALVSQTDILVLDEPTARLGLEETNNLFELIVNLKKHGTTVIYISHRMEEIYAISDRISVFRDGLCIATRETKDFSRDELVRYMLGKKMQVFFPKHKADIGEDLLTIKDLRYKTRVNGVDLTVKRGEIVSIIGAVGAGKSEILNSVFGIIKSYEGEITIDGESVSDDRAPQKAIRKKIALVPEDRTEGMIGEYDIKNNISSVDMKKVAKGGVLSGKAEKKLAGEMVAKLDVVPKNVDLVMTALSGGNQQKVIIGKWLTQPFDLYLMDEVTAGVDIGAKAAIYDIISDLVKSGSGVLLATGEIEEALGISDRIIVLYKGEIFKEVKPSETTKDKLLAYIMGGQCS